MVALAPLSRSLVTGSNITGGQGGHGNSFFGTAKLSEQSKAYLEPCLTSVMEHFRKNSSRQKLHQEKDHHRCLTGC